MELPKAEVVFSIEAASWGIKRIVPPVIDYSTVEGYTLPPQVGPTSDGKAVGVIVPPAQLFNGEYVVGVSITYNKNEKSTRFKTGVLPYKKAAR
jgi:hypothetical protein